MLPFINTLLHIQHHTNISTQQQININNITNKYEELKQITHNIQCQGARDNSHNIKKNTPNYTPIRIDRVRKLGGLLPQIKHNITFTDANIPTNINTYNT